ncbi:MAG TPA: hypothetical protein VGN94_09240 [Methylobacterium sp.]|nr:hypothetical protein [Methylobacterium sp.]
MNLGTLTRRAAPALALLILSLAPAAAEPTRYSGTIVTRDDDLLTIRTRAGASLTMRLVRGTRLLSVTDGRVRDIKPESYLSALTVPAAGGGLTAREVTLYAASLRGILAGHRPWEGTGAETLTTGWVDGLTGDDARTVSLRFEGGTRSVRVPAETRVTQAVPGEKALLVDGAEAVVQAHPGPKGDLEADLVAVGRRGAVPAV